MVSLKSTQAHKHQKARIVFLRAKQIRAILQHEFGRQSCGGLVSTQQKRADIAESTGVLGRLRHKFIPNVFWQIMSVP
jgi:hypothetical protein